MKFNYVSTHAVVEQLVFYIMFPCVVKIVFSKFNIWVKFVFSLEFANRFNWLLHANTILAVELLVQINPFGLIGFFGYFRSHFHVQSANISQEYLIKQIFNIC